MIIFLHDDRAYLAWVAHHRQGFVVAGRRKPNVGHLILHRASCGEIKSAPSQRTSWTTGVKLKACSLDRQELETGGLEETGKPSECCRSCQPEAEHDAAVAFEPTKLARVILDFVLEAALIHLEHEHPPYHVTVSDVAACFAKSPGQIALFLRQLIEGGLLAVPGGTSEAAIRPQRVVFPTPLALRTLAAFQAASDAELEQELARLQLK